MICYCGRGLFTLHVESAAWETNPDETTLKKNSFNVAEGEGRKPAISLAAIFIPRQGEPGKPGRGGAKKEIQISRYPRWI